MYILELAFKVGRVALLKVEKVGWFTGGLKDSGMINQSKTMPDLADVLSAYGVGG